MDLLEIQDRVNLDLHRQIMSSKVLCNRSRLLDEGSRKSAAFADDTYIPFYYHLGKCVIPRTLFRYGFGLGLFTGSFLQGCNTVEHVFAFREGVKQDEPACKLGAKNLRDVYHRGLEVYVGSFSDKPVQERLSVGWDIIMVDTEVSYDDFRYLLDVLWKHVSSDGWMVVDRVGDGGSACQPFQDFAKISRLDPCVFDTRYGTGVIYKP